MTRSARNDTQRQLVPKVEQGLRDLAELAVCDEVSTVESGAAPDSLDLGHAGVRNECWSGASGMRSETSRTGSAGPRLATQRLPRPPRRRTPLHCLRPSQQAEARFTPDYREFLTF
jgi:hypothetical protein